MEALGRWRGGIGYGDSKLDASRTFFKEFDLMRSRQLKSIDAISFPAN